MFGLLSTPISEGRSYAWPRYISPATPPSTDSHPHSNIHNHNHNHKHTTAVTPNTTPTPTLNNNTNTNTSTTTPTPSSSFLGRKSYYLSTPLLTPTPLTTHTPQRSPLLPSSLSSTDSVEYCHTVPTSSLSSASSPTIHDLRLQTPFVQHPLLLPRPHSLAQTHSYGHAHPHAASTPPESPSPQPREMPYTSTPSPQPSYGISGSLIVSEPMTMQQQHHPSAHSMSECAPLNASSVPDVFMSSSTTPKATSISIPVARPALRSSQSHNGVFQAPASWPRRAMTTIMNTPTSSIVPSSFERTRPASTSTSSSGLPPSLGSMLAPPPPPHFAASASAPGPTPTPVPRADPSVARVMGGVGGGSVSIVSSQHEASAPSTSTPSSSAPFATHSAPHPTYPPTSSSTSSSSSVPITQTTHTHNHNHTHSHSQYSTSYPPTSVGVSFPSYDSTPVHHQLQPQPQAQAQSQPGSYPPYDPFASPHWQMSSQPHASPALQPQPQHEPHGYMSYHHHQSYYPYPMPQTAIKQDEPILALGELPAPRPPMSYAALIGEALLMAPPPHQLYVSEISDSIKKRYAYYRQNPTKIYNGVRHQTSMCKAFVKLPRPFGDQSGGARKWAIRAGCENWFSNGGYHPPGSSPFSSPPSRPRSAGGKAKATAAAKRLAIGTSTSSKHGLGGSIKSEPFSPSSSTGGPSVGPAFDGTTRPAWVAAPSPPQQYAQAPYIHPGYHYVPVGHSSSHPSAPGVYFWPHYSAASAGSDSNSSPVAAAGQITASGHVYPTPPITQPAASPGWSNARFELIRDTHSTQHGRSIHHQSPPSVAGSQGSYDDNQPVSPASIHDTHLSVHSQPSPDL